MSLPPGQVAIVSGAARGIGREIALTLAREGVVVAAADIDGAGVAAVGCELKAFDARSDGFRLDVASPPAIEAFVAAAAGRYGRIDILVNNAAVTQPQDLLAIGEDDFDRMTAVNFKGAFFLLQAVARRMEQAGSGRIVNIASIAGKGFRDTTNIVYAGAKGALIAMTRVAAARLGPHGVTVNAVCPGMTETGMMRDWLDHRAAEADVGAEEMRARLSAGLALRRMNAPADVALSVLFLVSPGARNITGQSLNVDGGLIWD